MIFLNPAVLFGLLAASIPVLIHLLNLRKLKRIDFSTLSFLKELQKNKIRKIKLKQWLLLLLRVALILFLVTAFARPTLKGIAIGGTTSAAKTTAVFVLDNTPSMSVVDQKGSYFNQAKAVIKQLAGQLNEGDDAALILVGDPGKKGVKATSDLTGFGKQVDGAKISDASGYLNTAVVKAAHILSTTQNFNKEIYLLSDFQKGRIYEPGSVSNLGQVLNKNVRMFTFDYSGKDVFNAGISGLKLNTQIFEKNKPVDFSVTVTNYSNQPINNLIVSIFINNERSAQQSISLAADESKIIDMQANINNSGYVGVTAEIEDDDILQDNKRFLSFYVPRQINVLILTDDPVDSKYVNLALAANNLNGELKIEQRENSQISSVDFSKYDAVIVIGTKNITGADRLLSYVNNGGGLMLMPGSKEDIGSFGKITSELKIPPPVSTAGKINSPVNAARFEKTDFNHPIFEDLYSNKSGKNIESPQIYYYFRYNTEGKGESIITLTDGSSFLSDFKKGKGKIFVLNSAPVLSWGTFPLKSIFAPLFYESVFYLASQSNGDNDFTAGSKAIVGLGGNISPQVRIERPDGTEDFINLQLQNNMNFLEYDKTDLTGNYKIYAGDNVIGEFSVNSDPAESVTDYLTMNDFNDYLKKIDFKGKIINVGKNQDPVKIIMQSRFGSELWQYFLGLAFIIALIEMAVARNAKKELTDES